MFGDLPLFRSAPHFSYRSSMEEPVERGDGGWSGATEMSIWNQWREGRSIRSGSARKERRDEEDWADALFSFFFFFLHLLLLLFTFTNTRTHLQTRSAEVHSHLPPLPRAIGDSLRCAQRQGVEAGGERRERGGGARWGRGGGGGGCWCVEDEGGKKRERERETDWGRWFPAGSSPGKENEMETHKKNRRKRQLEKERIKMGGLERKKRKGRKRVKWCLWC